MEEHGGLGHFLVGIKRTDVTGWNGCRRVVADRRARCGSCLNVCRKVWAEEPFVEFGLWLLGHVSRNVGDGIAAEGAGAEARRSKHVLYVNGVSDEQLSK
eukprot:GHVS01012867.1.p3 GENE.GHVS01012867.1~~GHVS01012867.1.p3  ORF type:complete len:100 (+),score=12.43 GHVS01012867.1:759-1058(+)